MKKRCKACLQNKKLVDFKTHMTNTDRRTGKCKTCIQKMRNLREENNTSPDMNGTHTCTKCKVDLLKTCFLKNKSKKTGLNTWCKRCTKDNHLKKNYGISILDYESMLRAQHNKCAVCKTSNPGGPKKVFVVDHCHVTKKVRGLLCNHCNTGIGKLGDNIEGLVAAIQYLSNA